MRLDALIIAMRAAKDAAEFLQTVWYESQRTGLKPELVLAIVQTLSQYRKYFVSAGGERGYMAVSPRWSRILGGADFSPSSLFHMQTNLRFGCVVLRHLIERENGNIAAGVNRYLIEGSGLKADEASRNALVEAILATESALAL
jgi:soluble lytic murein transglycosylase-like protein